MRNRLLRLFAKFTFPPWLVICLALPLALPAHADSLPTPDAIKNALAAETVIVEQHTLDKDGLNAFYATRDYKPAWNFTDTANSTAFTAFLDSTAQLVMWHGLQNEDYAFDAMRKLSTASDDESHLKLELLVTDTLLQLAHDLHGDNIDLSQIYTGWKFERPETDIPGDLAKAVDDDSVNKFLEALTPKNTNYLDLARALGNYRTLAARGGWHAIDPGPALRPGDHGQRVEQLRARLSAENYIEPMTGKNANIFDEELRKALENYQMRNRLDVDGHAGEKTLQALNVPISDRIDQIRANMERWRHMPDDFPPARAVIVNIADASVDILEDGHPIYRGPVIVGQLERKTPFINSVIHSMIINPAWHVPSSIAHADILPKLREDPHYLEKMGIIIRDNEDDPYGRGIDWKNFPDEAFDFKLRQEPGNKNSLGQLKFDFDNPFAVYMHGTPHQELFRKNERTLSSGCVRLRDPEMVAQILLADTPGDWDIAHIEDEIAARKTRWLELKNPMPIYILYWTVFADENVLIQFRNDIYDYDHLLMQTIKGEPEPIVPSEKNQVIP